MIFGFYDAGSLPVYIFLFVVGLVLLIKGGDWFVDGATSIAKLLKMPEIIVGATIVSIGTTLPEVMVSTTSAIEGVGDIAYGNAIGSIICNTALIAAITISIAPSVVKRKTLVGPVIFFYIACALYIIFALSGYFARWTGIILLVLFVIYMCYTIYTGYKNKEDEEEENEEKPKVGRSILLLIFGADFIAVGARFLVDNGQKIAVSLGVPTSVIALTFVALGTSLPELITAIVSLRKGHGSLSLGNIIGANIFNLVLVSGMSITVSPFAVPSSKTLFGINSSFIIDIPLMVIVMTIMCIPALIHGKLKRWQGISLLVLYAGFCVYQFIG